MLEPLRGEPQKFPFRLLLEFSQIQHGNTSNPSVLLAANAVAKKAVEKGLMTKPAGEDLTGSGSRVAGDIYKQAGLMEPLRW